MAARLQHQLHDLAMPRGTFLIGRGADCQLALDDPLVSRRHAAIRVADDGSATVEDLGSRNGVFLNGVRIDKPEPLRDGDLIRIGSQDIAFCDAPDDSHPGAMSRARVTMQQVDVAAIFAEPTGGAGPGSAPVTAPSPAVAIPPPPPSAPPPSSDAAASGRAAELPPASTPRPGSSRIPVALAEGEPSSAKPSQRGLPASIPMPQVRELRAVEPDDPGESTTIASSPFGVGGSGKLVSGLAIIGSVADKALALGRAEEAERILSRSLNDVMSRAPKGEVDAELAERAATYAVRLAAGTGRGAWIDYIFQLYTTLRALMPGRLVDELYAAVRKVKATDKSVLRAYTTRLKEISSGFGPSERFVQQRIESFERWAP
jgi:hypothetical protein